MLPPDALAAAGIYLRRLHLRDAEMLCAAYQRSRASLDPSTFVTDTIERALLVIASAERLFATHVQYTYGVFDGEQLVGCAALQPHEPRAFSIDVWIDERARRRGFASAAVTALTALAFERLAAERTELWVMGPGCTIAERAGYQLDVWSSTGGRRVYQLDARAFPTSPSAITLAPQRTTGAAR